MHHNIYENQWGTLSLKRLLSKTILGSSYIQFKGETMKELINYIIEDDINAIDEY